MKLIKPSWVHHDDKPIFSIDVHPDCEKFATGGLGMDAGRVVIWNLLPVLSKQADLDEKIPKILCQMDSHLSCVNCVRWSLSGQMLASGSDDKLVMIWRRSAGQSGNFGTGGMQTNHETWKCCATLRGHSGDVLDLAWSPQDQWLASSSVDNTIFVWDAHAFPNVVAILKGHTGLVKGVAWDPVGKYLCSQSDDRSAKIWKTSDWTCSNTITEPFVECGGTTHILRLNWSPDGQYLVSAHAMNGGGPTAQIIERDGWKCDKDFVGHWKAVTCVRFHNSILTRKDAKSNKYCCLAMGSRDRSLSVWLTALQRPLVVIHDLFADSVLDLSWGADKCVLMACSSDGTIVCLQFSKAELGTPMTEEEKSLLYQRIYGKNIIGLNGTSCANDVVPEIPELLHCQQQLPSPTLPNIEDKSLNQNQVIEQQQALSARNTLTIANKTVVSKQSAFKQFETKTADGKRRITPILISNNLEESNLSQHNDTNGTFAQSNCYQAAEVINNMPAPDSNLLAKRTADENEQIDTRLSKKQKLDCAPNAVDQVAMTTFSSLRKQATNESGATNAIQAPAYSASTAGPKINITANTVCQFQKTALNHRIHVHNGFMQTTTGMLAKVTAYDLGRTAKLWQMFVGSAVVNLNFCTKCVMLCSLDGTMRLLSLQTGIPMLPVLTLTSAVIQCAFSPSGHLVGVITDNGILRIWNIDSEVATLATSCSEVFNKYGGIVQFFILANGMPILLFANGNAYCFSLNMQCWLVLSTKDPIMRHALKTTLPKDFKKNYQHFPITSIQATCSLANGPSVTEIGNDWQAEAKITFIENQIKLCQAIESIEELQHWYAMLAYHLALHGTESRVRLLLNELLSHSEMSISKQDLLQTTLNVLKAHAKWQRIYMEYKELFDGLKINEHQMKLTKS